MTAGMQGKLSGSLSWLPSLLAGNRIAWLPLFAKSIRRAQLLVLLSTKLLGSQFYGLVTPVLTLPKLGPSGLTKIV
jgi:hypothetical protein